jgi:predicted alpha/beta-hydrolase family hydrolase
VSEVVVGTPEGPARAVTTAARGPGVGTLVLGHGAGGRRWTDDLLAVRDTAADAGWAVVLVEQPWRVAGRRVGPAPAALDRAWLAVLGEVVRAPATGPLVVGGRSAGARVACRTATAVGAAAVVALSFPLHPPGRPERSRAAELALPGAAGIPVHVVQGRTDPFGSPAEVAAVLPPRATLDPVDGPHSLEREAGVVGALVLARLPRRRVTPVARTPTTGE